MYAISQYIVYGQVWKRVKTICIYYIIQSQVYVSMVIFKDQLHDELLWINGLSFVILIITYVFLTMIWCVLWIDFTSQTGFCYQFLLNLFINYQLYCFYFTRRYGSWPWFCYILILHLSLNYILISSVRNDYNCCLVKHRSMQHHYADKVLMV